MDSIEVEPVAAAEVFGGRVELARQYAATLASDGVVRGLIGPREAGRLWSRHLLNCGVVGTVLSEGSRVVDIGSGAGLPGIPLAIARPDCDFILVEPLERRANFLAETISALGLVNCKMVRGRADDVVQECGEADVVTSRAVAALAKLASWSSPLLRVDGKLLALKGSTAAEEVTRDRAAVATFGIIDLVVRSVGAGLVDPETLVVSGRRIEIPERRRRKGNRDAMPKIGNRHLRRA